jgi:hypothetical protein
MADQVIVFSNDLVKWSADKLKVGLSLNLYYKGESFSHQFELFIKDKVEALNTTLAEIGKVVREKFSLDADANLEIKDSEMIQKNFQFYFDKVKRELNNGRNGKSKTISRYNLFYLKDPEMALLSDDEKFLAYKDIIERKAAKEQFTQIGSYLKEALALKPDDKKLLQYQSQYFMDTKNSKEAVDTLLKLQKANPDDQGIITQLIRLYDGLGDDKNVELWCTAVLKTDPKNLDALVRKAQYKYFAGKDYTKELDVIKSIDFEWLKKYLRSTWEYKLPKAKTDLNPIKAAHYLGFEKALDIVSFAFRNEIPAHTNTREARVMFCKAELDSWHKLIDRYDLNEHSFDLYPNEIN